MPLKDRDAYNAYRREKYKNDPEFKKKILAHTTAWYAKNKKRQNAYRAAWAKKNRNENIEYFRNYEFERELKKYGVNREWYDAKLAEQNGVCAICLQPEKSVDFKYGRVRRLAIDHGHKSGKARGLLCGRCNKFLFPFEEVENWAERALQYLKSYE